MIVDYKIFEDVEVANKMAEGWELCGDPLYIPFHDAEAKPIVGQAMTITDEARKLHAAKVG